MSPHQTRAVHGGGSSGGDDGAEAREDGEEADEGHAQARLDDAVGYQPVTRGQGEVKYPYTVGFNTSEGGGGAVCSHARVMFAPHILGLYTQVTHTRGFLY